MRQKEHLWLPAGESFNDGNFMTILDSNPARAHLLALSAAYDIGGSGSTIDYYSAERDFGLYVRWEDLSRTSETAGKIINLIWTDIMANLVVRTKPGPYASEKAISGSSYRRVVRPL